VRARRDGGLERLDVVRAGERHPRDERAEALPLGGLSRGGQRAERPPVEALLERHEARAAGRLARDLERRLVGLGAGAAEEGLRAARARGKELREPEHRLRPVEGRRVPQRIEVRVRRRSDRGVPVPEAGDRDPAAEVEVRAPFVVPDAAALAADDRQVCACVRRQDRSAIEPRAGRASRHAGTSVTPIEAWTPPRAARTAATSFGTMPPSNSPASSAAWASSARSTCASSPSTRTPGTSLTNRI